MVPAAICGYSSTFSPISTPLRYTACGTPCGRGQDFLRSHYTLSRQAWRIRRWEPAFPPGELQYPSTPISALSLCIEDHLCYTERKPEHRFQTSEAFAGLRSLVTG